MHSLLKLSFGTNLSRTTQFRLLPLTLPVIIIVVKINLGSFLLDLNILTTSIDDAPRHSALIGLVVTLVHLVQVLLVPLGVTQLIFVVEVFVKDFVMPPLVLLLILFIFD